MYTRVLCVKSRLLVITVRCSVQRNVFYLSSPKRKFKEGESGERERKKNEKELENSLSKSHRLKERKKVK